MEYREIGASGLKVSPICVGTAFRGIKNGLFDEKACIRTIERAVDVGLNFFDSANIYFGGKSEEILGKALRGRKRDDLVLSSKVGNTFGTGATEPGSSRPHIMREIDRSLKRLKLDHLDIYVIHQFDPDTEMAETLQAMGDLIEQGKIRHFGISNYTAAQVVEALWTCDRQGLPPPLVLQDQYSLLHRWEIEPELMGLCSRYGLGMMAHSALGIGLLSGKFRKGQTPPDGTFWALHKDRFERVMTDQIDAIVQALIDIGDKYGKSPAQVAVTWIIDHPEITAAVIGPDAPEHVDEICGSLEWNLPKDARKRLDDLSKPDMPKRFDRP